MPAPYTWKAFSIRNALTRRKKTSIEKTNHFIFGKGFIERKLSKDCIALLIIYQRVYP